MWKQNKIKKTIIIDVIYSVFVCFSVFILIFFLFLIIDKYISFIFVISLPFITFA